MNEPDKNTAQNTTGENAPAETSSNEKKKISLSDFKVKSFVTKVKIEQMQFLKTAGG